jgi:hypothetical protein
MYYMEILKKKGLAASITLILIKEYTIHSMSFRG